jgi:hypothetical protein
MLMAVGKTALSQDAYLILTSTAGVAIRQVRNTGQSLDPIVSWLLHHKPDSPVYRDYALRCLTHLGQVEPSAASAVREIFALDQNRRTDTLNQTDIRLSPDCAISAGDNLFLSGRFSDPHDLIRSVKISLGDWSATIDRQTLSLNSSPSLTADQSSDSQGAQFAVLARGPGRLPVFGTARAELQLKSGTSIELPPLALLHANTSARQKIFDAAIAINVTDRQLSDVIAPALKALADADESLPLLSCDVVKIGPRPKYTGASIIIPLTGDMGLMTTWISAVAAGIVDGRHNELVFVLSRAAGLAPTEQALGNLYRRSGISSTLVAPVEAVSGQDILNASVLSAACDRLVFLGEGCLPCGKNTLPTLLAALKEDAAIGLAGGAVLDPSGSIIHAGYTPPHDDRISAAYAGFPAASLAQITQQQVFACSSELFALDRVDFEQIGGFTSKYLSRAWGDADFSRRIGALGKSLCFDHRARATRFRFTGKVPPFESTLANRIDAWRFSRDWPDDTAQQPVADAGAGRPRIVLSQETSRSPTDNARRAA